MPPAQASSPLRSAFSSRFGDRWAPACGVAFGWRRRMINLLLFPQSGRFWASFSLHLLHSVLLSKVFAFSMAAASICFKSCRSLSAVRRFVGARRLLSKLQGFRHHSCYARQSSISTVVRAGVDQVSPIRGLHSAAWVGVFLAGTTPPSIQGPGWYRHGSCTNGVIQHISGRFSACFDQFPYPDPRALALRHRRALHRLVQRRRLSEPGRYRHISYCEGPYPHIGGRFCGLL